MNYRDRKYVVKVKGLCFRCLQKGHILKDCRCQNLCEREQCNSTDHHTLMHWDRTINEPRTPAAVCSAVLQEHDSLPACLDIVPVRIQAGNSEVVTYALLDPGSSMSFCSRVLVDSLKVNDAGLQMEASIETMTTACPTTLSTVSFDFKLRGLDSDKYFDLKDVAMVDRIPVSPKSRNCPTDLSTFDHLKGVELSQIENGNPSVSLLIGNDNY